MRKETEGKGRERSGKKGKGVRVENKEAAQLCLFWVGSGYAH